MAKLLALAFVPPVLHLLARLKERLAVQSAHLQGTRVRRIQQREVEGNVLALAAMVVEHQVRLLVVVREKVKGFHARVNASRIAHLFKKLLEHTTLFHSLFPQIAPKILRCSTIFQKKVYSRCRQIATFMGSSECPPHMTSDDAKGIKNELR